jgi:hypothetical protein
MIVERTFRETRTEKNFQKGATFFLAGASVALTIGFLFRTGDIFDQRSLTLEASLRSQACWH